MEKNLQILILLLLLNYGCISGKVITYDMLEQRVSEKAAELSSASKGPVIHENRSGPSKGYYYILKNNGEIAYHPKKGLKGSDFSRFGFVKKILKDKNGCIRFDTGDISRIIIFKETCDGAILCYTTPDYGIAGSDRCEIYKEK